MDPIQPPDPRPAHRPPRRNAFSLVEVVVAMMLVSLLLVAALSTVGASRVGQRQALDEALAANLAHSLLEEVMGRAYEDTAADNRFGTETGESTQTRAAFDDVDDYHKWSAAPPVHADGTAINGAHRLRREVAVLYVKPDNPNQTAASPTDAKRVTVTVSLEGRTLAQATAVRTRSGP